MTDNPTSADHNTDDGSDPFTTGDPLTALIGTDLPLEPRPEFAASLNNRLHRLAAEPSPGGKVDRYNRPTTNNQPNNNDDDKNLDEEDNHEDDTMSDTPHPSPTDSGINYLADLDGVSNLFYFSLPAPDIDKAKTFYGTVLGWRVEGGSLGGHVINVTPPGGLDPTAAATDTHTVYLTVFDLDAAMAKVRELGGTVEGTGDYGTGRMARCRDDQGTRFCLQEPSEEYLDHAHNPAKGTDHGDLFYFSLPVPDGDTGRRFYQSLLGWNFGPQGSAGGMHAENMITDGGIGAGRGGHRPEFWFRVDDLAASIETVRSAGGTATDPMDTPQGPISQCSDDQGVEFGLIQPTTAAAGTGGSGSG